MYGVTVIPAGWPHVQFPSALYRVANYGEQKTLTSIRMRNILALVPVIWMFPDFP